MSVLHNDFTYQQVPSMYFTCESRCPPEMLFSSYDPLTGDMTCHSSPDTESNSVYMDRRRGESASTTRRLGAGLVVPLAAALIILLVCIALGCYCKRHRKRLKSALDAKPTASRFSRLFDKVGFIINDTFASFPNTWSSFTIITALNSL